MSYVYCIPVDIESKEKLNEALKNNGLMAEVIDTELGEFFICPRLGDNTDWQAQVSNTTMPTATDIAPHWDDIIYEAIKFLLDNHHIPEPADNIRWRDIDSY